MTTLFPYIAHAAPENLGKVADLVVGVVNSVVPVLIGIGVVFFFWGVAQMVLKTDDPKALKEGKKAMVYGVVSLFVVVSLWWILQLVLNTFI